MLARIKATKKKGYVKTHRKGDTGIGKTLEDLLGIKENNIPGPNGKRIELKSARQNSKSMLTFLTKAPLPSKANSALLQAVGYPAANGKKHLHTTLNALSFNTIKTKSGLMVEAKRNKVVIIDADGKEYGYWDRNMLKEAFERKLPSIAYVKADSKGTGANEQFWYNEAWILNGFSFANFIKLLKNGTILVDVRIGRYPNGSPHDHGTGFRVKLNKLDLCFSNRKKIM